MSPAVQPHQRRPRCRGKNTRRPVRLGQAARATIEPGRAQIHAAIPEDSQRAKNQPEALRALEARIALEADLGRLRADAERNALAIARAIVFSAKWQTRVTRPGWDTLMERTGLKRTSIAKYLRLFNEWGLLGRVRTGSTHRTRGGREDDEEGNLAGEYVLCVPAAQEPVEETRTPSLRSVRNVVKPHASARENATQTTHGPWPMHQPPKTRGQRLAATRRLQDQAAVLARLGIRQLRSILRPWYDRGWTPAQVLYALDHGPDGILRWHTADVRHVPGWIRSRLAAWDGHTPPRQLGAGRTTDLTAGDVAQLPAAGERSTVDVETHATPLRQLLAATQKRSGKKQAARRGLGVNLPGRDGRAPATVVEDRPKPSRTVEDRPVSSSDGGDWLLRNAAARARTTPDMPGRAIA